MSIEIGGKNSEFWDKMFRNLNKTSKTENAELKLCVFS